MNSELKGAALLAQDEKSNSMRPQDALLCAMDLPLRGSFYPLGYPIDVVTNAAAVLIAADASFGHARLSRHCTPLEIRVGVSVREGASCPPEPTRREYNQLYSLVADVDNQSLLDLNTGTNFTWLTQAVVANGLYFRYNFLEKVVYLLLGATVVTDIHAACVGRDGKGILLCGESGAGKSTLAYACAREGWTYTSDDTSYLINDAMSPRVIGHCHRARFRPSAKLLFPELETRTITPRMEGKPSIEVATSQLPIQQTAPEADVHAVVYLNRNSAAESELVQLPRGTATRRMRRELYSAGEIRAKHERILQQFWETPAFELRYGSLEEGIRLLGLLSQQI
jgi:hypothetical protein